MIRKIIKFILIIICMIVIFLFSADDSVQSSKKSDYVITKTITFLKRDASKKEINRTKELLVVPVRKAAHFTIYLLLGVLVISFIYEFKTIDYKIILLGLLICFLYACSDEFHQLFSSGRSAEVMDVLLDTLGSFCGIMSYSFIKKWRDNHEQEKAIS